jgi:hypothetical protein
VIRGCVVFSNTGTTRTAISTTTPVREILARGRRLRAGNRTPRVVGAPAVAAGAAVAVTAIIHGGHPAPDQAAANTGGQTGSGTTTNTQLAAFTVTRQPDGGVKVTIRQLSDAAGLAAALRADGVPAYVGFARPAPANCQTDPTPGGLPLPGRRAVH